MPPVSMISTVRKAIVAAASRGRRQRAELRRGQQVLEQDQQQDAGHEQHVNGRTGGRISGQRLDRRNGSNKEVADYPDHALVERRRHGRRRPVGCSRIGIVVRRREQMERRQR